MKTFREENGLTFIEIILSLTILAILSSTAFVWFLDYYRQTELDSSAKSIVNILRKAQSNSTSGKDFKNWGAYFDDANNKLVLFRDEGSGYGNGGGIAVKEENYLSSLITISSISLNGGGKEIIFNGPRGETLQYGIVRIEDSQNGNFKDITITQLGLIGSQ